MENYIIKKTCSYIYKIWADLYEIKKNII
jgi:hypothetical protein